MKKKLLITLLAVCVLTGTAAVSDLGMNVWAEEYAVEAVGDAGGVFEKFVYNVLEDGTVEIIQYNYNGTDKEVVIPAEIDGKTVSSIGNSVFFGCSSLTSITIPNSVESIGEKAFYSCSSLSSITIPESVTSIGDSAFFYCSSLSSITIPEGVTSIGDSAFFYCSSLSSIIIPESVTSIESSAFLGCSSLNSITIPEGVTSIGNHAFNSCSSLSSITIPESVTSIGGGAFWGCSSLSSITIPDSVTSIENGAFAGCSSLRSIIIPEGITSIKNDVFNGCSNLSSITIPDSVTSIESSAFLGCSSLRGIIIPEGVTSIGRHAFSDCSSLRSIIIPEGVTSIGDYIFSDCLSLSSITIPESVTNIEYGAFYECDRLEHIYYSGTKDQWMAISVDSQNEALHSAVIHCTDGNILSANPETLTANNVWLSTEKATYNSKAQTPTVIVKDSRGNTVPAANYTVQYADNQNVGQARVTVTFKGSYSGTATKTFDIVPKGTKLSKVTAKKKGFTVKWQKQTEQTTGYEIQYSTSSSFKDAKTAGNIKAKKTSKTISKLKAKKKYYVRIRTYKTVNGKKYYSDWSAKKSVKTKK